MKTTVKIGIRPVIDGRWGGICEGLEEQTRFTSKYALSERLEFGPKACGKSPSLVEIPAPRHSGDAPFPVERTPEGNGGVPVGNAGRPPAADGHRRK